MVPVCAPWSINTFARVPGRCWAEVKTGVLPRATVGGAWSGACGGEWCSEWARTWPIAADFNAGSPIVSHAAAVHAPRRSVGNECRRPRGISVTGIAVAGRIAAGITVVADIAVAASIAVLAGIAVRARAGIGRRQHLVGRQRCHD